jgi:nucleoside-diphosphate-sugar epimerase
LRGQGWHVVGTGRAGTIDFADDDAVRRELVAATHVLSSVPPAEGRDPVLERYFRSRPSPAQAEGPGEAQWLGYLSSTGVYGDAAGAWVDETAPTGTGRRADRSAADAAWLALGARVFRLPGIYGPRRSALERVADGRAHRTGLAGQVFSRVHVDDIVAGVIAGFDGPPGAYNLADDRPSSQDAVVSFAAHLLGLPPPPLVALADLPPMARGFYAENRRVANSKAKRLLGWSPRYGDYRAGLRSVSAMTSPTSTSPAPSIDSGAQR